MKLGISGRSALLFAPLALAVSSHSAAEETKPPPPSVPPAATPARVSLSNAELDGVLAEIAKARKPINSFKATFTQKRTMRLLATTVDSKGELAYAAPDRLRWELSAPDDIVYFVGPEGLSYKTKTAKTTLPPNASNVAKALADLRALLTGDLSTLRDRYNLVGARVDGDVEIKGVAKDVDGGPKANVKEFVLTIDKGLVLPLRARLVEGKNDTVDIVFARGAVNVPLDPQVMKP